MEPWSVVVVSFTNTEEQNINFQHSWNNRGTHCTLNPFLAGEEILCFFKSEKVPLDSTDLLFN